VQTDDVEQTEENVDLMSVSRIQAKHLLEKQLATVQFIAIA
jgi:hypothetical protein